MKSGWQRLKRVAGQSVRWFAFATAALNALHRTKSRLVLLLAGLFLQPLCLAAADSRPNVIFMLVDDLGWTDLGCFGSDFYRTPHIDRLAREGMKFTQAYSACTVCSPTRASILTGKYPARLRVTDWIPGRPPANPKLLVPDWTKFLALEENTVADVFKAAGYRTASIGKWHLGSEAYYPEKHGFELNLAGTDLGSPVNGYFSPWKIATLPDGREGEYLTDRIGDEAVKFIERTKDQPFFLYLPHFGVHTPIQARPAVVEKYRAGLKPGLTHSNAVYAAMVESVDDTVGRIRDKLDELGLSARTAIVFTSDNGGHLPTTSNRPLRVGKGSCYEGGTRVPLIVHWPGVTRPGSQSAVPVISPDYYPTLLELAGLKDVAGHRSDGVSLVPLLRQAGDLRRKAIFWHYPHYQLYQSGGTTPYSAIRAGDFKLIEFHADQRIELYHLKNDLGEQHDLAAAEPKKAGELRTRLHAWRREVGAQMPAPNPDFDSTKPEHLAAPGKSKKKK
jgi:arylsulfatase A